MVTGKSRGVMMSRLQILSIPTAVMYEVTSWTWAGAQGERGAAGRTRDEASPSRGGTSFLCFRLSSSSPTRSTPPS